jgi:hypothetical protein
VWKFKLHATPCLQDRSIQENVARLSIEKEKTPSSKIGKCKTGSARRRMASKSPQTAVRLLPQMVNLVGRNLELCLAVCFKPNSWNFVLTYCALSEFIEKALRMGLQNPAYSALFGFLFYQ